MAPEIRRVREDELPAYLESMTTAFLERPDVAKVVEEVKPYWNLDRTWAAVDGDRICGTFRTWATELTVPGGARLPAAAVSAVTVLPSHRRRGILRSMVAAEHGAIRERHEAVSLLYASEYPIYGRFGYGPGCREATWTNDARGTSFHGNPMSGVEIAAPSPEAVETMKTVFEAWRLRQPGEIRRRDHQWAHELGLRESAWGPTWKGFLALHRDASGTVDGYVRYRADDKWDQRQPRNTLTVDELHALTDEANAALWRFLFEIDWAATVKAERRSPSDRLPWLLTNARAADASDVGDGLWVRLLDIPRALESRTYDREGDLALEVVDAEAPGGRVRVRLEASRDGAVCRQTDRSPDLTLDVAALGAAYLGGTRLRDAVIAHGADEHRAGALADAERLLLTPNEPWCSTFF
jgi:predicted acetyltransferase